MTEKQMITANDLKPGQSKVVIYRGPDYAVIVPDPSWNMHGDLSKLPGRLHGKIRHYSKNGFTKRQSVIDSSTPFGRKVLSDIEQNGYSIDNAKVEVWEEFDCEGKRITWEGRR